MVPDWPVTLGVNDKVSSAQMVTSAGSNTSMLHPNGSTCPAPWIVHPLASVTVTEYVPGGKLIIVTAVLPLLHRYVYPGVPPPTFAVAVPLLAPTAVSSV